MSNHPVAEQAVLAALRAVFAYTGAHSGHDIAMARSSATCQPEYPNVNTLEELPG